MKSLPRKARRFGEIVQAAIVTAFPAAQKVIEVFWKPADAKDMKKAAVTSGLDQAKEKFKGDALTELQKAGRSLQ